MTVRVGWIGMLGMFALALTLALVLTGCGDSPSSDGTGDVTDPDGPGNGDDDSDDRGPADHSLRVAAWEQRGGPNPRRRWTLDDYRKAAGKLEEMAQSKPWTMPRHDSEKSRPIFERLTNPDNLATISGSTDDRAMQLAAWRDTAVAVAGTYHRIPQRIEQKIHTGGDVHDEEVELMSDRLLDREAVELDGFALDVMIRTMTRRIEDLTAAGSDPRNITVERRLVAGYLTGLIQRFENKRWFTDSSMRRYGEILAAHLPVAFEQFDLATRDELLAIIEATLPRVHTPVGQDALYKALRSVSR